MQSSIAQLQLRQNQLQASLETIQTQVQDTLANVVTQEELQTALANVVTQEDLSEGFYIVQEPLVRPDVFPPDDLLISTAECHEGDVVISGGFSINAGPPNTYRWTSLSTTPISNGEGWTSSILASSSISFSTTALCFNNP